MLYRIRNIKDNHVPRRVPSAPDSRHIDRSGEEAVFATPSEMAVMLTGQSPAGLGCGLEVSLAWLTMIALGVQDQRRLLPGSQDGISWGSWGKCCSQVGLSAQSQFLHCLRPPFSVDSSFGESQA